jgi:hypothetical protein
LIERFQYLRGGAISMNRISISQAWDYATSFFSNQHANHAIALIGVGIVVPTALQWLLIGDPLQNAFNPAALAGGANAMGAMGGLALIASIIGYVFSFGGYFTSWRLGLSGRETIGSALTYGLMASGAFIALLVGIGLAAVVAAMASPWLSLPFFLAALLAFVVIFPVWFGFLAIVMLIIAVVGSFAMSAMMAAFGINAPGAGGGALVLVLIAALAVILLWLAARLGCTAPLMAERREFLPFRAFKESWLMTSASQGRIMGYFLLIGLVLLVLLIIVGLMVGGGFQTMMSGNEPASLAMVGFSLLLTIPMVYLTVAVPAGIYKALGGGDRADIFA